MEYSSGSFVVLVMLIALVVGLYFIRRNNLRDRMIIEMHCPPQLIHIILTENLHKNVKLWEGRRVELQNIYGSSVVIDNAYYAVELGVAIFFDEKTDRNFIVKYHNGSVRSWATQEERSYVAKVKTPQ